MAEVAQRWVTAQPRPPSFSTESNPGLSSATSKLLYANFMKSSKIYEEARDVRNLLRNDPLDLLAKRTASRPRGVEVNTGLNTSLKPKRPQSAQQTSLTRARSSGCLDRGMADDSWPVPINPETGRPVRPDPRERQFYKTRSTLTMGVVDGIFDNPSRKATPQLYMAQRYGVHAVHPVKFPGRYTPSACRIDSTGDLSVGQPRLRPHSAPVRPQRR
mmetsp:Transcript_58132/g.136317  ORF Transcript_58132/g.136317 Transcript_58132/m.136317 type:complete len:216 (-) Transcript_58132:96-743(-)